MYGNGINNPYIMSNMSFNPPIGNMMQGMPTPLMRGSLNPALSLGGTSPTRGLSGILGKVKTLNFSSLLTNTSKALGVVKEAIPVVKEVGPMFGNMKQMLKIASIFKDETDSKPTTKTENQTSITNEINKNNIEKDSSTIVNTTITESNDNKPNFFL